MHLTFRKSCRVCGSTALTQVINLGDQYLQGSFVKPGKEMPPMRKIPLSLVRCDPTKDEKACGLLQMEHTVPPEILYSSYWYRSGTNNTMRNHLKGIVEEAVSILNKSSGSVLDIGCNDGTLFDFYQEGFRKYGVDPSDVAQEIDKQAVTVIQDIFPSDELLSCLQETKMDIITSIAMFYDLEDPIAFAKGIKKSGMKIFNVTLNDINGGSLRYYAIHTTNFRNRNEEYLQNIRAMHQAEFDMELDTDKPYKNFQDRINVHREELIALLKKLKTEGNKIHIYGASTKGNTILQWCGIDNKLIDCAAERNPEKYGAHTLGTDIPIVSEAESRALNPDYYLVLPWHFKEEFIEREQETLQRGTKLIFPLPKIEIISK
jgi:SAM-dependent methyltransferase